MVQLSIIDESSRAVDRLKLCFQGKYDLQVVSVEMIDEAPDEADAPDLVLYLSIGDIERTRKRIHDLREVWPKSFIILAFPSLDSEMQLGDIMIPAHRILFKPCTKKRIIEAVDNYASMISDDDEKVFGGTILNAIVEFVGGQYPSLYVFYNRLIPLMVTLCGKFGYDWAGPQMAFTTFVIILSNIDKSELDEFLDGDGRSPDVQARMHEHVQKVSELLSLSPPTEQLSQDIKYILKMYDGRGFPKDDVKGLEIPVTARIIRLLMDYHHLLQGGQTKGKALFILSQREGWYDHQLLSMLIDIMGDEVKQHAREVYPLGLLPGMEIAEDVYGMIDGKRRKILAAQEILTEDTVDYLQRHCADVLDITEPVKVVEDLFSK